MGSWKDNWNQSFGSQTTQSKQDEKTTDLSYVTNPTYLPYKSKKGYWMTCWSKYADFSGRARRSEYWTFIIVNNLICVAIMIISLVIADNQTGDNAQSGAEAIVAIGIIACIVYGLAVLLPSLAVTVRRLHDTGHSGGFFWIQLVPFAGPMIFFFTMCLEGKPEENVYGKNPKTL